MKATIKPIMPKFKVSPAIQKAAKTALNRHDAELFQVLIGINKAQYLAHLAKHS